MYDNNKEYFKNETLRSGRKHFANTKANILGTPVDGLVLVCKKMLISWDFHIQQSLQFIQNSMKNIKHPVSGRFCIGLAL